MNSLTLSHEVIKHFVNKRDNWDSSKWDQNMRSHHGKQIHNWKWGQVETRHEEGDDNDETGLANFCPRSVVVTSKLSWGWSARRALIEHISIINQNRLKRVRWLEGDLINDVFKFYIKRQAFHSGDFSGVCIWRFLKYVLMHLSLKSFLVEL